MRERCHYIKFKPEDKKKIISYYQSSIQKVLVAYDNSFVFVCSQKLVHFSKNGDILKQFSWNDLYIKHAETISPKLVLVLV